MRLASILNLRMLLVITSLMHDLLVSIHLVASVCKDFLDYSFGSLLYLLLGGS